MPSIYSTCYAIDTFSIPQVWYIIDMTMLMLPEEMENVIIAG